MEFLTVFCSILFNKQSGNTNNLVKLWLETQMFYRKIASHHCMFNCVLRHVILCLILILKGRNMEYLLMILLKFYCVCL